MRAKVTKQFDGVPDAETQVRTLEVDDEIGGDLARVAVENGWAVELADSGAAPAPKATGRGRGKSSGNK